MKTLLTTLSFAAGIAVAGAAAADEPFTLTEAGLDKVTAAGGVVSASDIDATVDIVKNVSVTLNKSATVALDLNGDFADAEAAADAVGYTSNLAETFVAAQVSPGLATSYSQAIAAGQDPS